MNLRKLLKILFFFVFFNLSGYSQTLSDSSAAFIWELPHEVAHGVFTKGVFDATYSQYRPNDTLMNSFVDYALYLNVYDTLQARGYNGVNNLLSRSYTGFLNKSISDSLLSDNVQPFDAHGSNSPDYIVRSWDNPNVSVGTMEIDSSGNINGYGPGIDFVIYHSCRCQSGSTPKVAAIAAAIKDSLQQRTGQIVSWDNVIERMKITAYRDSITHPNGIYPNELNGYGIPDYYAALYLDSLEQLENYPKVTLDSFFDKKNLIGNEKILTTKSYTINIDDVFKNYNKQLKLTGFLYRDSLINYNIIDSMIIVDDLIAHKMNGFIKNEDGSFGYNGTDTIRYMIKYSVMISSDSSYVESFFSTNKDSAAIVGSNFISNGLNEEKHHQGFFVYDPLDYNDNKMLYFFIKHNPNASFIRTRQLKIFIEKI